MAGKSRNALLLCCFFSILLALSSCGLLHAAAQADGSFKLRVDVDLATVEVIALDKNGDPVRNLKKGDFQLYEDGKKQEILSVDELRAESERSSLGASPIDENRSHRGKTVLIVFYDDSIRFEDFKKSRDSAREFVREHMRPQDLFAVATFRMSMKILQNFTSDREKVLQAIEQPGNTGWSSTYFEDLLRSLDAINRSIAPIKGQKSILIYSQSVYAATDRVSMNNAPAVRVYGSLNVSVTPAYASLEGTYKKTLDSAKKSNAKFYTVDPGELGMPVLGGLSLKSLALESGGATIDRDTDAELDKLDRQISNYYILGFQSNNRRRDGAFRKVKVKTELKGISLKHQAGYTDRRPIDVLASSKQEKTLLTALASPGTTAQIPIVFRPAYFYDSPRVARVLVSARIRVDKAAFRKKGGRMEADLNIMGVAYAEDGSIAARFSETLPVAFDKEKEAEYRKANLAYRNYFRLRPGKYSLKLAVSDDSENLGSMEQLLEVPALPDRGFVGSSIVIAEQTSNLPDLIKNLQAQLLDENDPLLYSGMRIEPSVVNKIRVSSAIPLMFRMYNLAEPSDQWNLAGKATLRDEEGKEYVLGPEPLANSMSPLGKSEAVVVCSLKFPDVPPGKYRLIIETSEAASPETATLQTDLEFVE
ncbi:MAG: VWA domain-containing protein [Acidobacteria bacterium]|nr:VWA domain-containing protein [Acidobacteriota bacterium]